MRCLTNAAWFAITLELLNNQLGIIRSGINQGGDRLTVCVVPFLSHQYRMRCLQLAVCFLTDACMVFIRYSDRHCFSTVRCDEMRVGRHALLLDRCASSRYTYAAMRAERERLQSTTNYIVNWKCGGVSVLLQNRFCDSSSSENGAVVLL